MYIVFFWSNRLIGTQLSLIFVPNKWFSFDLCNIQSPCTYFLNDQCKMNGGAHLVLVKGRTEFPTKKKFLLSFFWSVSIFFDRQHTTHSFASLFNLPATENNNKMVYEGVCFSVSLCTNKTRGSWVSVYFLFGFAFRFGFLLVLWCVLSVVHSPTLKNSDEMYVISFRMSTHYKLCATLVYILFPHFKQNDFRCRIVHLNVQHKYTQARNIYFFVCARTYIRIYTAWALVPPPTIRVYLCGLSIRLIRILVLFFFCCLLIQQLFFPFTHISVLAVCAPLVVFFHVVHSTPLSRIRVSRSFSCTYCKQTHTHTNTDKSAPHVAHTWIIYSCVCISERALARILCAHHPLLPPNGWRNCM